MANEAAQHLTDSVVQAVVAKSPYLAGAVTVIGGLTLNDWLTIMGLILMPATFILNWYMQAQRLKLMREDVANKHKTGEEANGKNSTFS